MTLPSDVAVRLRLEARRRGLTLSELTREAIESHLAQSRYRGKLLGAAAGRSGRCDTSARIEDILREEWMP